MANESVLFNNNQHPILTEQLSVSTSYSPVISNTAYWTIISNQTSMTNYLYQNLTEQLSVPKPQWQIFCT